MVALPTEDSGGYRSSSGFRPEPNVSWLLGYLPLVADLPQVAIGCVELVGGLQPAEPATLLLKCCECPGGLATPHGAGDDRLMSGDEFLLALGETFAAPSVAGSARKTKTSDEWTRFMTARLLELADSKQLHVCGRNLGTRTACGAEDRHLAREFMFDFTLYADADWTEWGLPSIIIEHENHWSQAAFLQDFWKLLVGYAPLRVMFGYAKEQDGVDALVSVVLGHAKASRWRYPPVTEDLVLLRCPEMAWPTWRVLRRDAGSEAWRDSGNVLLSGTGR